MNYKNTQTLVTKILRSVGASVSLSRDDVTYAKTYGVFTKSEDLDMGQMSTDVDTSKVMFIAVTKTVPEVGDYLIIKSETFYITKCEEYKPTSVAIAYKITVS